MEVYYEESLQNPNIDKHSKRTKVLVGLRYACVILFMVLIFIFLFLPIFTFDTPIHIIMAIVFMLLMLAPFVAGFIILGKMINNLNVEYDYIINGTVFRIVKVINRKKRKLFAEVSVSSFESLGKINSEAYDRLASSKDIKNLFAITDYKNEERVYYIFYPKDGFKYLLHIQPTNDMIIALRKCVSRVTILDKSFRIMEEKDEGNNISR